MGQKMDQPGVLSQFDKDLGLDKAVGLTEELWNSEEGVRARQGAKAKANVNRTARVFNQPTRALVAEAVADAAELGEKAPNTFLTMGVPMAMVSLMPLAAMAVLRRRLQRRGTNVE